MQNIQVQCICLLKLAYDRNNPEFIKTNLVCNSEDGNKFEMQYWRVSFLTRMKGKKRHSQKHCDLAGEKKIQHFQC